MTRIDKIWSELENEKSFSHGLLIRRYSGDVLPEIYVALILPEKFRCVAASFSSSINIRTSIFSNLRDICIEVFPDETKSERNYLLFKLLNNDYKDIFSVLCEDLIMNISSVTNEDHLFRELLKRFEKWKSLFTKAAASGLSAEEQRGLFGEIYCLRKLLKFNANFTYAINSWVGPEKRPRDFQYSKWAIEVKTTHGNNHQIIHINSELQLDTTNLDHLFLYHLSLDILQHSGETLNQIIESVRCILSVDIFALIAFNTKLLEAGYFSHHLEKYESAGYFVRQNSYYWIRNNFPRIEEKDIRLGVGEVKYSIITSYCTEYKVSEEYVLSTVYSSMTNGKHRDI